MRVRLVERTTESTLSFGLCKHEIPICLYGTSFASVHVSEVLESISCTVRQSKAIPPVRKLDSNRCKVKHLPDPSSSHIHVHGHINCSST
jgi:hypothetical protein